MVGATFFVNFPVPLLFKYDAAQFTFGILTKAAAVIAVGLSWGGMWFDLEAARYLNASRGSEWYRILRAKTRLGWYLLGPLFRARCGLGSGRCSADSRDQEWSRYMYALLVPQIGRHY